MQYQISRNGQNYGPYTLQDLQRYVASGNVLPTDMAKSEEMPEWIPVSQLLAGEPATAPAFSTPGFANPGTSEPLYAQPANPMAASAYPDAPNLHWGLYTLFTVLTCGYFSMVFTLVQAAWLKKVQPNSQGLIFYIAAYVLWLINKIRARAMMGAYMAMIQTHHFTPASVPFGVPLGLLYLALLITSRFMMRASLEEHFNTVEPMGLRLSPVMTFFFGGIYFQYHLNRINSIKLAARFGTGQAY